MDTYDSLQNFWAQLLQWASVTVALVVLTNLLFLGSRFVRLKFGPRIRPSREKGILITGATSGIGLHAAKHLHKLGFSVFAAYYNDLESGYRELEQLQNGSQLEAGSSPNAGHLFLVKLDVCCEQSIRDAGSAAAGPFAWTTKKSINVGLDTNIRGVMQVTREFLFRLIGNGGRVINVSSGVNQMPMQGMVVYGSTKSAVGHFSDALHQDISSYGSGISCHCIVPGNLIVNSNIIFGRVSHIQESERDLSSEERQLHAKSISAQFDIMYQLLAFRLKQEENPKEIASVYKFHLPEAILSSINSRGKSERPKKSCLAKLLILPLKLDGRLSQLNDPSMYRAFEDSVCLVNPPRRLYCGNTIYTYFSGPQLELLPPLVGTFLGQLVSKSWDKWLQIRNMQ